MSGWTPGPYVCQVNECVCVRDAAGDLIAMLYHLSHQRRRRAPDVVASTGKLFAASPDMADALRQWQHAEETGDDAELANARKSRDMALAKARGEGAES